MADNGKAQAPNQKHGESVDALAVLPVHRRRSDTPITEHFTLEELTHTDTGLPNDPPLCLARNLALLAETLEQVRELLGVPLHVSSGYRSERVNAAVGGAETSEHLVGRAADFVPMGMDVSEAFDLIHKSGIVWNQLIHEQRHSEWIHISVPCAGDKGKQETMEAHPDWRGRMCYAHV